MLEERNKMKQGTGSQEPVQKCSCIPGSNWNLEMFIIEKRGKPVYPEKELSKQSREPTANSTTYDAGSGNQTRGTLVEGEHSHQCAIPASISRLFETLYRAGFRIIDGDDRNYMTCMFRT